MVGPQRRIAYDLPSVIRLFNPADPTAFIKLVWQRESAFTPILSLQPLIYVITSASLP